jgi:dTDP-4-dehydrorhamnose reductase
MIWLLGCNGMLGRELARELTGRNLPFIASDLEVDITDLNALRTFAQGKSIHWIINAAAYTAVDRAESEEQKALLINGQGAGCVGQVARELDAAVIHFSTDYVFDGSKPAPYHEEDQPNPLSAYGRTKLAGEVALRQATSKHYIFRISWLYGRFGANFVATMLRLFGERQQLRIVADQYGAPTCARMLAHNTINLTQQQTAVSTSPFGLYHYADKGRTSWFEFATAIAEEAATLGLLQRQVELIPISADQYPVAAKRPANSAFDKTKVVSLLQFSVLPWRENLRSYLMEVSSAL